MNPRRRLLLVLLAAGAAVPALAQTGFPAKYLPGEHYRSLSEPAPTAGDGIEVIEFFLYSCPHCHSFEPDFQAWAADAPRDVATRQVPVTFSAAGPVYARLFYTAQSLGVLEEVHADVFAAIHEDGRRLADRGAIRRFMVEHGVDGAAFDAAFDSDEVARKVEEADALMRAYQVSSVPSLGVNGRYWVSSRMAGGQEAMLSVADHLVVRERAAK